MSSKGLGVAPLWTQPLRWSAVNAVFTYYHLACRIRSWGRLPVRRGPALLVANHQHEFESTIVVADASIVSLSWRYPIFTISTRRMWEPGFLAGRIPWMSPLLRGVNLGRLFAAIGMQPIENDLHTRPFASLAYVLHRLHGGLPVGEVFRPSALAKLPEHIRSTGDLLDPKQFEIGRRTVTLTEVLEPYRKEVLAQMRAELDEDIAHFEQLIREGATIFLAPEGNYSGDGKMRRFRGILPRLSPEAEIWLAAISYDPFVGRRLSLLYRVTKAAPGVPLEVQLQRTRPVTVSALLSSWMHGGPASFAAGEAVDAVTRGLADLPPSLFVDPELRADPSAAVRRALSGMRRLGIVRESDGRYARGARSRHPQFPRTDDMVAYQANFHAETLEGARYAP